MAPPMLARMTPIAQDWRRDVVVGHRRARELTRQGGSTRRGCSAGPGSAGTVRAAKRPALPGWTTAVE